MKIQAKDIVSHKVLLNNNNNHLDDVLCDVGNPGVVSLLKNNINLKQEFRSLWRVTINTTLGFPLNVSGRTVRDFSKP